MALTVYLKGEEGPLSLVSWSSGRRGRIAHSSLSADMHAAGGAQEEGEYVRLVIVVVLFQDANMADRTLARSLSS